jgi:hypothetical protein
MTYQDYKAALQSGNLVEMKQALHLLRPDLVKNTTNEKSLARIRQLLANECNNILLVKSADNSIKVTVVANQNEPQKKGKVVEKETVAYPRHYPPVLVQKLVEARQLVAKKAKLSNGLYKHYVNNDQQALAEDTQVIKNLQGIIDDIYKGKENFDNFGYLPKSWVDAADNIPNDKLFVESRLNSLKAKKRGLKAKLKNPAECKKAGENLVNKWRNELKSVEEDISLYAQKLTQLINIG